MFSDRRIFPKRRFDPLVEAVAVKAYVSGLSLEGVRKLLEEMAYRVSKESTRRWFLKAGELFSENRTGRRSLIAVDEMVVYDLVEKPIYGLLEKWGGYSNTDCQGRGVGECLRFLEKVREACYNNLTIYTDRLHSISGL